MTAIGRCQRFAFFDVDDTLIRDKSMFSILRLIEQTESSFRSKGLSRTLEEMRLAGADRLEINKAFYVGLKGLEQATAKSAANKYFADRIKYKPDYLIRPTMERLVNHARSGVEPVFVSGSSIDILAPLARHLDVHHILATELECDRYGRYTGVITGSPLIGSGKRDAVLNFIQQNMSDSSACFAYGDHYSDLGFLELVGRPHVLAGQRHLEEIARERGWTIISS